MPRAENLDRAELSDLYSRLRTRLHRRFAALTGDSELAHDLVQDTFVRALRHADRFRGHARVSTWIYRIGTNLCLDHLRAQQRRRPSVLIDESNEPGGTGCRLEASAALDALFRRLDDSAARTLWLHLAEGHSQGQVAAQLGVSRVTVNRWLQKARALAVARD